MLDEVVAHIPCTITDELNAELLANFTREEMVVALKQMEPLKVPGSNRLPPFVLSTVLACSWRRCD